MSEHSPTYNPPPDTGLDIRYIDDALLVVDKPAGLLSVPGRGAGKQDCLSARVQARYPEALPVHRLDLGTSGLLVLARSPDMHRALNRLFEVRRVNRKRCDSSQASTRNQPEEQAVLLMNCKLLMCI